MATASPEHMKPEYQHAIFEVLLEIATLACVMTLIRVFPLAVNVLEERALAAVARTLLAG